jgi:predicted permease
MDTLLHDLRYALRQLASHKQFTITVLLILGIGIGANATIFGLMEGVLFRPLPAIPHAEQLIEANTAYRTTSYPAYRSLREDARGTVELAGGSDRRMSLSGDGRASLVRTEVVSENYFSVLQVAPALGRTFSPGDGERGASPVAVLSWNCWKGEFGGDPSVVGRTVYLNDRPALVIGVAAKDFRGLWLTSPPDLWVPIAAWPALAPSNYAKLDIESRSWGWVTVFGRLAPGATIAKATAVMNASFDRQKATYPKQMGEEGALTLRPSLAAATGAAPRTAVVRFMAVLMTVVGLVLLLICANVANLLLARASARRREFGVRVALGASRRRIVRQLLSEALVLSGAAAFVAWIVLGSGVTLLSRVSVGGLSLSGLHLEPDGRVLGFMAALALACAVLFGLVPARQAVSGELTPALRDGAAGGGHVRSGLRGALLAAQLALGLVLLVGAGLFTRALQRALRIDPGFSTRNVAIATVNVGLAHYDTARAQAYFSQANDRLAAIPQITAFGWASDLPLSPDMDRESAVIPGYSTPDGSALTIESGFVTEGYFGALRIPISAGREFLRTDASRPAVAIVNETAAARFWPGRSPLGARFVMLDDTMTVVGVARDLAYHQLGEPPRPYVYLDATQFLRSGGTGPAILVARMREDAEGGEAMLRGVLLSADPHVTPYHLGVLDDQLREALLPQRAGAIVLGAFSLLALLVAMIGVYGVASYAVSLRTREIGIRVALGARTDRVVRTLVAQHARWIAAGVIAGLALAAVGTRALASFLYGVSTTDLPTFAAASLLLAAIAIAAAAIPARRAAKVDPVTALRTE